MRFSVEYLDAKTKMSSRESVSLVNSFLNYHLIGEFHGWSYECIFIKLVSNASPNKKWKLRRTYEKWGEVELPVAFADMDAVLEFNHGFEQVKKAVYATNNLEIKGTVDFRSQQLLDDIDKLAHLLPKSIAEYQKLLFEKPSMDSQFQLRRVDGYINACKKYPIPHTRRIAHVRIYDHFDNAELMPYRYMYSEIFSTLLRNVNISTPGYQEIYFSIDKTLATAKTELALECWHKYTYCAINIDEFRNATPEEREHLLLNSLIEGLRLISDFDHLDQRKIESVIDAVSKTKCRTPLTYAMRENEKYKVRIHYQIGPDHTEKTPFYITITNKFTGKDVTKLIDNFDILWVPYCISKVKLLKERVEILGGGGLRGHISRDMDHMPDGYKIQLDLL
jgi:hypothetical protein